MSEGAKDERSGRERLNDLMSEALGVSDIQSLVATPVAPAPVTGPVSAPTGGPVAAALQGIPPEEMAALDTCGMYGGLSIETGGLPCQMLASFGIPGAKPGITQGKCFKHCDEKMDKIAVRKAEFLERYMNQPAALEDICKEMSISCSQPYLWKMTDRAFAKVFEAMVVIADAVRHHLAEDAMFARIRNVEAGADTLRMFYFQNRSGGRWRDTRKDQTPQGPTIVNTGSGNVQVTYMQMGDEFIPF